MRAKFIHLSLHSEFSLVDGIVRIPQLVKATHAADMPAVAITERCNLFSLVKFYRAALGAGIKPIIGADVLVHDLGEDGDPFRLILLCRDAAGYQSLARLISRSYIEGSGSVPLIRRQWIAEEADGLIALSGGRRGDVGSALLGGRTDLAEQRLEFWAELFPDRFYIELTRTGREGEEHYIQQALKLAAEHALPVVATNDVCFLQTDDFEAHEARVCIQDGRTLDDPRRIRRYSEQQYLRSPEEMEALFADIPEALENSVEIARRCNVELKLGHSVLPDFPIPEGFTEEEWFAQEAREGLKQRLIQLGERVPEESYPEYDERLQIELDVICRMGFPGYFLIVADFIRWSRENEIPVGPGRGSGAGSLVAYALGITDLDPIGYELLFERFLNPERVSLPDFDIDFCMEGRDRVIEYVSNRYGAERVSQIITFGTMAARAVVRDVGRVLGHPYGFVDQIAKLIPFEIGMTLDKALKQEEALLERYENDDDVHTLMELAGALEGIARNAGKHAGGVVIAPTRLTDFSPLYCELGGTSVVTQLDKDDVEAMGLVKFDFLGLRTLTIIDRAVRTINSERAKNGENALDIADLPTDDPLTFELIQRAATTGVFQLESRGMRELISRLQPDCFEEIIALVALFRPGPLQSGMVDDFIDRKHGKAAVSFPHPSLEATLKPTYGVILYQEQVMQIAQVLAGFSLGGADLLRRAMGKKKVEAMAEQRDFFVNGAVKNGVDGKLATSIFDLMEKFAGYGFNRSHSAAYALVAYQTAWLKAHYPAAFMAAVLSSDMDNTDKVVVLIEECRALGLAVVPPQVQHCDYHFTVADAKTVRYGLGAIKGVGQGAIEGIIDARQAGEPFQDLFEFCQRINGGKITRRTIEALIRTGALDDLGPGRAAMMASLTHAQQAAEQASRNASSGQNDLFGGGGTPELPPHQFADVPEWTDEERLSGEKETLGLYLTGHPIARHEAELQHFVSAHLGKLQPRPNKTTVAAGLVIQIRVINTRRGRMAVITLDDRSGRMEAVLYADVYQHYQNLLTKDRLLVVVGEVAEDEFSGGCNMSVQEVYDLCGAREHFGKVLVIDVDEERAGNGLIPELTQVLEPFREGPMPVCLNYRRNDAQALIQLGAQWRVRPSEELLHRLRQIDTGGDIQLRY